MKNPKRIAAKRLKRRRIVAKKIRIEREILAPGRIIMFGHGNRVITQRNKPKSPKKPKAAQSTGLNGKVLKPYLAVKLTAKLDKLTATIRDMAADDPRLASLKQRRDVIKRKLSLKK